MVAIRINVLPAVVFILSGLLSAQVKCDGDEWGNWRKWSECSSTCGRGVKLRTRECISSQGGSGEVGQMCIGVYKQYEVCHEKACPEGTPDYRTTECSRYNKRTIAGRRYRWVPYKRPGRSLCELSCKATRTRFYARVAGRVPDGTECQDEMKGGICVAGKCQRIGCDGVLGSGKVLDKCGVCGGNNNTCHQIAGIFTRTDLSSGYNKVTTIPKGSCNINITEMSTSNNYLALRNHKGTYVINGNWALEYSNDYKAAGTIFTYYRPAAATDDGREYIIASGPTNQSIDIMVLSQSTNRGIMYSYTIPMSSHHNKGHHHSKQASSFDTVIDKAVQDIRTKDENKADDSTDKYDPSYQRDDHSTRNREYQQRLAKQRQRHQEERRRRVLLARWQQEALRKQQQLANEQQNVYEASRTNGATYPQYRSQESSSTGRASSLYTLPSSSRTLTHLQAPSYVSGAGPVQPLAQSSSYSQPLTQERSYSQSQGNAYSQSQGSPYARSSNSQSSAFIQPRTSNQRSSIYAQTRSSQTRASSQGSSVSQSQNSRYQQAIVLPAQSQPNSRTYPLQSSSSGQVNSAYPGRVVLPAQGGLPGGTPLVRNSQGVPLVRNSQQGVPLVRNPPQYVPPSRNSQGFQLGGSNPRSSSNSYPIRPNNLSPASYQQTYPLTSGNRGYNNVLSIPNGNRLIQNDPGNRLNSISVGSGTYTWKISGFTECSVSCGGGIQQTLIICAQTDTAAIVTDDNCDAGLKPRSQSVPCNSVPCPPGWAPESWGDCTTSCGIGTQSREVKCRQIISPTLTITVKNEMCTESPPDTRQYCNQDLPCVKWQVGNWTDCNVQCGRGRRSRSVVCVNIQGNPIAENSCEETKPDTSEVCDLGSCAQTWFYTHWDKQCSSECGEGVIRRNLYCNAAEERCRSMRKPRDEKTCKSEKPCGGKWFSGPWGQCTSTCGSAVRTRDVTCIKKMGHLLAIVGEENCNTDDKPETTQKCQLPNCLPKWYMSDWADCSKTCGTGYQTREVKCLSDNLQASSQCPRSEAPDTRRSCNTQQCYSRDSNTQSDGTGKCKDKFESCELVVQARLCRYPYYERICCNSCSKKDNH